MRLDNLMIRYKKWRRNVFKIRKKWKEKCNCFKTILNQNTSELNIEALAALISAPATDANRVLRSSASTRAPTNDQIMNDNINEDFQSFDDEET
ncbi:hypothetical protein KIW84_065567 [Lathyrus oleraceus]|uniref:Uncharacterized protein n=1 Tax=Pisum sativum TaxID=3888 RepID=A0A9D4WFH8_PEA|nr:hypothetical protein KIW84_065567 [Pisum sativum]